MTQKNFNAKKMLMSTTLAITILKRGLLVPQ